MENYSYDHDLDQYLPGPDPMLNGQYLPGPVPMQNIIQALQEEEPMQLCHEVPRDSKNMDGLQEQWGSDSLLQDGLQEQWGSDSLLQDDDLFEDIGRQDEILPDEDSNLDEVMEKPTDGLGPSNQQALENDLPQAAGNNGQLIAAENPATYWSGKIDPTESEAKIEDAIFRQLLPDKFEVEIDPGVDLDKLVVGQSFGAMPTLNGHPYYGHLQLYAKYTNYPKILDKCVSHRTCLNRNVVDVCRVTEHGRDFQVGPCQPNKGYISELAYTRGDPKLRIRFSCSGDCRKNFGNKEERKFWTLVFSDDEGRTFEVHLKVAAQE